MVGHNTSVGVANATTCNKSCEWRSATIKSDGGSVCVLTIRQGALLKRTKFCLFHSVLLKYTTDKGKGQIAYPSLQTA